MKKIRILSLDGGGIRGIIPGVILKYLEEQIQKKDKTNDKIGDYFDFIAGTSTGGILACCYLMPSPSGKAKYSAEDALDMYMNDGGKIFHSSLIDKITRGNGLFDEKYSVAALNKDLMEFYGETNLSELIKPCLITSYEITDRRAHFFTSVDAVDDIRNFKVHDVARATSAAPTYFEPAQIKSLTGQSFSLIDGGLYANNPALCAYAEARKINFATALNDPEKPNLPTAKDMIIVSVGTGSITTPYYFKDYKNAGQLKWISPIIDILMSGNSETVDYQLQQMYKTLDSENCEDYYRISPTLREALSDMDIATEINLKNLKQAGLWYIDKNKKMLDKIVDRIIDNK